MLLVTAPTGKVKTTNFTEFYFKEPNKSDEVFVSTLSEILKMVFLWIYQSQYSCIAIAELQTNH